MNKDKFQDKYKEILQNIKEEKLDWDFENFLEKVEESPIPASTKKKKIFTFWGIAASMVVAVGLFSIIKNTFNQSQNIDSKSIVTKIKKEKNNKNFLAIKEIQDSIATQIQDTVNQYSEDDKEAEQIINKILPKKGRIKKLSKQRYVSNTRISPIKDSSEQEAYVTINGQAIKNEKEAIDVTKYSFVILSENLSKTMAQNNSNSDDYNE